MAQSEYQSSKEGTIKIPVVAGLDQRSEQGRMNLGNFTEIGSNYQKYQHNLSHLPESFHSQRGTYPSLSGLQRRLLGKRLNQILTGSVSSIFQFWSPFGYGGSINQIGTNVDYSIWLTSRQDFNQSIPPLTYPVGYIPPYGGYDNVNTGVAAPVSSGGASSSGRIPPAPNPYVLLPDINVGYSPITGSHTTGTSISTCFPSPNYTGTQAAAIINPSPALSPLMGSIAGVSVSNPISIIASIRLFQLITYTTGYHTYETAYTENIEQSIQNFVYPSGIVPITNYIIFTGTKTVVPYYGATPVVTNVWFNYSGFEYRNATTLVTIPIPPSSDITPAPQAPPGSQNDYISTSYNFTQIWIYAPGYH